METKSNELTQYGNEQLDCQDNNSYIEDSENKAPVTHPIQEVPFCENCRVKNNNYFDFNCPECVEILSNDNTSIGQLMAIARQWSPSVQSNIDIIIQQMLLKGAHPDDRDQMTDMTILHLVSKSGAKGMGDASKSLKTAIYLIEKLGADPNLECRLNNMTALHIAVQYDVEEVVSYLVSVVNPDIINSPCTYLESQTPLHIAATNLSFKSARILLSAGANILLKDSQMRTPLDCVPEFDSDHDLYWYKSNEADMAIELRSILEEATLIVSGEQGSADMETMKTAKVVLSALGLEIGDKVIVGNAKVGTLRYCGPTQFASGIWTGVELDEPIGKNDGSIDGVQYFICAPDYGIFAPINRISKFEAYDNDLIFDFKPNFSCKQISQVNGKFHNYTSGYDISNVQSKIDSGLNRSGRFSESNGILSSSSSSVNSEDIHIGSKVFLTDKKAGTVRFIGMTQFASGIWYGIELTRPLGKNDGSIQGIRYFQCNDQHGVFVPFSRIKRVLTSTNNRNTISNAQFSSQDPLESDETNSDISLTISGTSSLDIVATSVSDNLNSTRTSFADLKSVVPNQMNGHFTLRRSMSVRKSIKPSNASNDNWLRLGVNVLVNGMVAVVRYIGPVHFTEGIFLGVELRTPNGKNDGSIDGQRYFTCKPNFGLLVRPKKVTVRGINASKLLPDTN